MERSSKKDAMVTLAVLVVIVFVVMGAVVSAKNKSVTSKVPVAGDTSATFTAPTPTTDQSATTAPATPAATTSQPFKDGTYTASADYFTPEDTDSITVSITLKDGSVTDTSASVSAHGRTSREYDQAFLDSYKDLVVGKKITDIRLSRVSGSSLTTQGFNDALDQIRTKAQA